MPRDPDKIDRWLGLDAIEAAIPAMEATGTSEVARGVKPSKQTSVGFIEAYRFAEGDPETMADLPATKTSSWADRRRQFVLRHLAQMRSSDTHGDGFKPDGTPTKRMLGLIAWAYIPPESTAKAKRWYKAGCPMKATRKRRNQSSEFGRETDPSIVWYHCGGRRPGDAFDIEGYAGTGEGATMGGDDWKGVGGAGIYLTDNIDVARMYCQYADAPFPEGYFPTTPGGRDALLAQGYVGAAHVFDRDGLPHGPFTEIVVYVPEALTEVDAVAVNQEGRSKADLRKVIREEGVGSQTARAQEARAGMKDLRTRHKTRRNPGRREALLTAQILPVPKGADAMVRRMGRGNVGTLHRIILRGEAAQIPALSRLGYVRIVKVHPSGSTDAPWEVYDVRTTQRLHDAVKATQEAREAYRDEFQQVGLFGARRNEGAPSLFGTLPTRPAAAPAREVVPRGTDLFDTFAPLGAPAPGEKGYKPPPAFPRGAWDEQNPHEVAARLIDAAYHYLDEPETREMYEAAVEGRSEAAEEYEEIPFTLPDLLGVPYRDGRGSPMTMAEREAIAVTAMDYAMEGGDRAGGTAAYDVLDPGKSRRGPARPRSGRDQFGQIPRWAATAILGDRLASITLGYKNTLRLVNVGKETARRFIEKHHSALPYLNPAGMMYAIGAVKGDRLVAVATAGHPTGKWARRGMLDPRNIVELTRVASDGSVKGAASKLTGRLLRLVASSKRGDPDAPALFITYQLESESGTTYKALADMGLRPVAYLKGKEPSGKRAGGAAEDTALARVDKIRWEYSPSEGVALPAKWSLLEKQPVQGTLLGASRSNPSGWDDPRREGSEVQSVIFDAGRWTLGEARAWLRRHAYDGLDPDRTVNTLRFRQRDPARYRRDTFRTISMGDDTGIQAVVAVPR
jgi:hypothetical protein